MGKTAARKRNAVGVKKKRGGTAKEMNNKSSKLESIFKGRLEESGCKLGYSHDPSEDEASPFLGHLH